MSEDNNDKPTTMAEALNEKSPLEIMRAMGQISRNVTQDALGRVKKERRFNQLVGGLATYLAAPSTTGPYPAAYREIIDMGPVAIPFIIGRLRKKLENWGPALVEITGENPVKTEDLYNLREVNKAWMAWHRAGNWKRFE